MSVKAMSLVWDLECPKKYGDVAFKPSHKYVLIAYADHADHTGMNIFPAVPTIARKTGLDDRTIQRLTNDLETIGFLIEDGTGPRGTNKWKMPFNDRGDKLSPVAICRDDKTENTLGDIPSGDIPSGVNLSPEFKEPEPIDTHIPEHRFWERVIDQFQKEMPPAAFNSYLKHTKAIRFEDGTLSIATHNAYARDWLESRIVSAAERLLIGIMNQAVEVRFVVMESIEH